MPKIFVSYRRADNPHAAGRICDRLIDVFGRESVFYDIDSVPLGTRAIAPHWVICEDERRFVFGSLRCSGW
ncbi:hypothetical protein, partial [Stieleria varia]|uniref:hypothetical protein n=1 Tax=Stieleria varia TaxID=2528005 RepID=UPI001E2E1C8F